MSTTELQTRFTAAVAESKTLSQRPDNMTLLKLYALYKQATVGDNQEKKPSFTDMVIDALCDYFRCQRRRSFGACQ